MSEMPNRLTTTFALMLPGRLGRSHHRSPRDGQSFSGAIQARAQSVRLSQELITRPRTQPVNACPIPFLQLTAALQQPGYSVQMPIPDHRQAGNGSSAFSWRGLWGGLGSLLNQSLERFGCQIKSFVNITPRSLPTIQIGAGVTERVIFQRSTSASDAKDTLTPVPGSQPKTTIQHALHQPLSFSLPAQPTTNRRARAFTSKIVSPATTSSVENLINRFTEVLAQRPSSVASPSLGEPLLQSGQVGAPGQPPTTASPSLGEPLLRSGQPASALTSFPAPENASPEASSPSFPPSVLRRSHIVEQILQIRAAAAAPPTPQSPTVETASPHTPPITIQGGIHVQITAQTIDPAHAEATARTIADQMLKELNRITERDRFRRGL
jgi:hypothetical protein